MNGLDTRQGHLRMRRPAGGRAVAALVLLGSAGLVWWMGATQGLHTEAGRPLPDALWQAVAAAVGLVGGWMLLHRSGISIELATGEVASWWGLIFPMRVCTRRLEEFDEVTVTREVRRSDKSTTVVYPVRLTGTPAFDVATLREALPARALGEAVAKAAWKPLRVSVSDAEELRPPEQLDWSLARRLRERGAVPSRPAAPLRSRVRVTWDGDRAKIETDAPGMMRSGILLAALAVPAVFLAAGMMAQFAADAPTPVVAFFCAVVLSPVAIVTAITAPRGLCALAVTASPTSLVVEERRPWGVRRSEFDAERVEAVLATDPARPRHALSGLLPMARMTVVTDERFLELGVGHSAEDVAYLAAAVTHALCGRDDQWSAT